VRQWLLDPGSIYKALSARFPDPSRMLVGGAKPRYPERRRVSECATEVCRRSPGPRRGFKGIDDRNRLVAEKALGQRCMIRPAACIAAGGKEVGQVHSSLLGQSDEIDGLAPTSGPFRRRASHVCIQPLHPDGQSLPDLNALAALAS
jgi:hypothetical protein